MLPAYVTAFAMQIAFYDNDRSDISRDNASRHQCRHGRNLAQITVIDEVQHVLTARLEECLAAQSKHKILLHKTASDGFCCVI